MILLYGANGYTGELVARLAAARGDQLTLAGRNGEALARLGAELGMPVRAFALDDPAAVEAGIDGATVVLHCAGPFSHTSRAMVEACLKKKVHYLDITGEVAVFEACAARDVEARAAGVMVMPGAGFDVVPSDCLAAHLKRRLPSATHLALAFQAIGSPSRGTATTMVEGLGMGGLVRRDGKLTPVPVAHESRTMDLGRGPVTGVAIPWGDVSTAWYSTKIPNIVVYLVVPAAMRAGMKMTRYLGPLLATGPVQRLLKRRIQRGQPGPNAEQRERGKSFLWGEVTDDAGGRAQSRLQTPEGYALTAESALAIAKRVDAGDHKPGFQTPSLAYGADFVLTLPGVTRSDD